MKATGTNKVLRSVYFQARRIECGLEAGNEDTLNETRLQAAGSGKGTRAKKSCTFSYRTVATEDAKAG